MKVERIDLYAHFNMKRPEGGAGYLNTYVLDSIYEKRKRPAMLVIAGGGYGHVSDREKEPIALKYLEQGYNAFTLEYSVAPVTFPASLIESCMAMIYIRENAEKLQIDKDHIAAIGFSAGGHLLGSLSTMYNINEVVSVLGKERAELARPDASVFSYPVITAFDHPHIGSFINLTGGKEEMYERLCIEKRINKSSPPAFIWTTVNDNAVPSENTIDLAIAYKKAGVPFELHMFEDGLHGLAVCTMETGYEQKCVHEWIKLSINWLSARGFVVVDDPSVSK